MSLDRSSGHLAAVGGGGLRGGLVRAGRRSLRAKSRIVTDQLEVELDHDTGGIRGAVLKKALIRAADLGDGLATAFRDGALSGRIARLPAEPAIGRRSWKTFSDHGTPTLAAEGPWRG